MPNKVRYDENFGLNLDEVVAWKRIPTHAGPRILNEEDWDIELYISGNTILVERSSLSEEAFNSLLQHLLKEFPCNYPEDNALGKVFG